MYKEGFAEKVFFGILLILHYVSSPLRLPFIVWNFFLHKIPEMVHDWRLFRKIQRNPEEYKKLDWMQKAEFLGWLMLMKTKRYIPKHTRAQMRNLEDKVFNVQKWAQDTFK